MGQAFIQNRKWKEYKSHDSEEISSLRHNRADALLNSHDSSGPVQVQVGQNFSMEKGGSGYKVPPLTEKVFIIGNCWERENTFSPME